MGRKKNLETHNIRVTMALFWEMSCSSCPFEIPGLSSFNSNGIDCWTLKRRYFKHLLIKTVLLKEQQHTKNMEYPKLLCKSSPWIFFEQKNFVQEIGNHYIPICWIFVSFGSLFRDLNFINLCSTAVCCILGKERFQHIDCPHLKHAIDNEELICFTCSD